MWIKNPAVRAWIYGILSAVGGLALIYGIVDQNQLSAWLVLGGAILGLSNGLALSNTDTQGRHEA